MIAIPATVAYLQWTMNPLYLGTVRVVLATVIFTLAGNAIAEEGWLVSFEKAKEQAAKEGKPRLVPALQSPIQECSGKGRFQKRDAKAFCAIEA